MVPYVECLYLEGTLFYDLTRDSIANNFVIDFYSRCLEIQHNAGAEKLEPKTLKKDKC